MEQVFNNEALRQAARAIVMYKANDEGLALFRVQAAHMLDSITARAVAGKPPTAAQRKVIDAWLTDGNDMFRIFFQALNAALGREYITL